MVKKRKKIVKFKIKIRRDNNTNKTIDKNTNHNIYWEIKKIITKLSSNKIKNNITQKEYATKSSKEWLSWLN